MSIKPMVKPSLGSLLTSLMNQRKKRAMARGSRDAARVAGAFTGLESLESRQMLSIDFGSVATIGGKGNETNQLSVVDDTGNVLVVGSFVGQATFGSGKKGTSLTGQPDDPGTTYIAKYDAAGTLLWARQIGEGAVVPDVAGIAVDPSGAIYLAGSFEGAIDFNPGTRAAILTSSGHRDIFAVKLDFSGDMLWARRFGSGGDEVATAVAINSLNELAIAGRFEGSVDFNPGTGVANLAVPETVGGAELDRFDGFVNVLDDEGTYLRAFSIDTPLIDSLATDLDGSFYLSGHFQGNDVSFDANTGTDNVFDSSISGTGTDLFLAKYDLGLDLLWVRTATGTATVNTIALDGSGGVYLAGHAAGDLTSSNPGETPSTVSFPSGGSGFIASVDSDTGGFLFINQIARTVTDIEVSGSTLFATGVFSGTTDFNSLGTPRTQTSANPAGFAASYDAQTGLLNWVRSFSGSGTVTPTSVGEYEGDVVVGGSFTGTIDFDPNRAAVSIKSAGGSDSFAVRIHETLAPVSVRINSSQPATFIDADGDKVTISIKGPGSGLVFFNSGEVDTDILAISLINTTVKTTVTITTSTGGSTTLGSATVTGSIGSLLAPTTTLTGTASLTGNLGQLALGDTSSGAILNIGGTDVTTKMTFRDVTDLALTTLSPIGSITTRSWTGGSVTASTIGSIVATAGFSPTLELSGVNLRRGAPTLGAVKVGGQLGGTWNLNNGNSGKINAGSVDSTFVANANNVGAFTVAGDFAGTINSATIAGLTIGGNMVGAHLTLVAGNITTLSKLTVAGFIDGSDLQTTGNFGAITAGAIRNSNIFAGVNHRPTLSSIATLSPVPNSGSYSISFADLRAAANENDIDSPGQVSFRVVSVTNGTLTINSSPVVPGVTVIGASDTVVWTPALGTDGTQDAFTVVAYDGSLASNIPVQVKVYVKPLNVAPTLTTVSPLPNASEDQAFTITYAMLAAAGNEFDADNAVVSSPAPLSFRIESLTSGTLTKNGNPVVAGTTLLSTGESLVWTPPLDENGTHDAFTVVAFDGALASVTPVQVKVVVAAVNDAPTFTSVRTFIGAIADTPYTISYASLASASDEADVDNSNLVFRVAYTATGSIWTMTANPATNAGTYRIQVTTPGYATDSTILLTHNANSSDIDSAVESLSVVGDNNVIANYNAGTLTLNFSASLGDVYVELIDDTTNNNGTFTGWGAPVHTTTANIAGTLTKNGLPVEPNFTTLGPGESFVYTPPLGAAGLINAFSLIVSDGSLNSAEPVDVRIQTVGSANVAPTLTVVSPIPGATAGQPFEFTFEDIAASANEFDANADTLFFRIGDISNGVLDINGSPAGAGSVIRAGDVLVWTGPTDQSGNVDAFTLYAFDGILASSLPITQQIGVVANQAPTLTAVTLLNGGVEDTDYIINYADLLAASNADDADGNDVIFVIASITTGTLTRDGQSVGEGTTLGPGQSITWKPALNASGSLSAFTVTVSDGIVGSSNPVQVSVVTAAVNDAPTLGSITTLTGASESQPFTITHAMLAEASNEADVDSSNLSFRVKAINGGVLAKNGGLVVGETTVAPGDVLTWTSDTNSFGTVNAFTIVAFDGVLESSTPTQVQIAVANGLPDQRSDFAFDRKITSITLKGIAGQPFDFINSNIAAGNIGKIKISDINTNNNGVPFGLSAINYTGRPNLTDLGDFRLRTVTL